MDKYTFDNLIINPETPDLESLIGKEVYFSDVPIYCINNANENYMVGILMEVRKDYPAPFFIETPSGCMLNYACIIPKVEPKPEYVPFESADEFISTYFEKCDLMNKQGNAHNEDVLCYHGIWLKHEYVNCCDYYNVTEIREKVGLVIGCDTNATSWNKVLRLYKFLDGTPCGKLRKDNNE